MAGKNKRRNNKAKKPNGGPATKAIAQGNQEKAETAAESASVSGPAKNINGNAGPEASGAVKSSAGNEAVKHGLDSSKHALKEDEQDDAFKKAMAGEQAMKSETDHKDGPPQFKNIFHAAALPRFGSQEVVDKEEEIAANKSEEVRHDSKKPSLANSDDAPDTLPLLQPESASEAIPATPQLPPQAESTIAHPRDQLSIPELQVKDQETASDLPKQPEVAAGDRLPTENSGAKPIGFMSSSLAANSPKPPFKLDSNPYYDDPDAITVAEPTSSSTLDSNPHLKVAQGAQARDASGRHARNGDGLTYQPRLSGQGRGMQRLDGLREQQAKGPENDRLSTSTKSKGKERAKPEQMQYETLTDAVARQQEGKGEGRADQGEGNNEEQKGFKKFVKWWVGCVHFGGADGY